MCTVRWIASLFLASSFFNSAAYRKKLSTGDVSYSSATPEELNDIKPLLGQCPKDPKTNKDLEGSFCDRGRTMKCCNHKCRYRTSQGSMTFAVRTLPEGMAEKLMAMGEHPSAACCREAAMLDVNGNWTCRTAIPTRDMFQQIPRGPMMHRWHSFAQSLVGLYESGVKELEEKYFADEFYHKGEYTMGEAKAKPMVMTLGGYSTGKTSFIKNLLGKEYRGSHIGSEPTTDKYTIVQFGKNEEAVPGEIMAVDPQQTFGGLSQFGNGLLRNFQGSSVDSPILQEFSILDTPGVLAGDKQFNRDYDFLKVSRWFADKADIILLMFDVNKIDISDELKKVIRGLGPNQYKVRLVLNKADLLSMTDFIRSYGGLLFGLGRVFSTPELKRVYVSSFKEDDYRPISENLHPLFKHDQDLLLTDLKHLASQALMEKLNKFIHRVKLARAHATLLDYLRRQLPNFGKEKKWNQLISSLEDSYKQVVGTNDVAAGDLPDVNLMKEDLKKFDFKKIPKLKEKLIQGAEEVLGQMSQLMAVTKQAFGTRSALLETEEEATSNDLFMKMHIEPDSMFQKDTDTIVSGTE